MEDKMAILKNLTFTIVKKREQLKQLIEAAYKNKTAH